MNYIQEINAFYIKIELNPLTASATALWHTLLHLNNRAGWINEFSVAATVICFKSGLPVSTFKRARNELRDKGYITYTSRENKAPIYSIISLVEEKVSEEKAQPVEEAVLKEKPAKAADEEISEETLTFYIEHFGNMTRHIHQEASKWAQSLSDSHVLEALKRAVDSGNVSWQYAKGILHNWKTSKLYSIGDVLEAEREFRERRSGYSWKQQIAVNEEVIPDWFEEYKRKRDERRRA